MLERGWLLDALGRELTSARHGRGRIVLIEGEAGIGKTTVLEAFLRQRAVRVRVLRGACRPDDPPRPFEPLRDLAATGIGGSDLAMAIESRDRDGVIRAALDLLGVRQPPTVLAIEDLHWADEGTAALLGVLGSRIRDRPLLVLATRRDDEPGEPGLLGRALADLPARAIRRLVVPPLSVAAVRRIRGPRDVDAVRLHRLTGGNPLLIEESGAAEGGRDAVSLRELVRSRLQRLSPAAVGLLRGAAVLGRPARPALVGAVAGRGEAGIPELVRSRLLVATDDGLAIRHELIRLAVLDTIDAPTRRRLHRRAAAAIAVEAPGDKARLAVHAIGAGDRRGILEWAGAAAAEAARLGSFHDAATLYLAVISAARGSANDRRADLLQAHAAAAASADDVAGAIQSQLAALRLRRSARDPVGEGDARRALGELWWLAGNGRRALTEARRAVEILEAAPSGRAALALALAVLAQRLAVAGAPSDAVFKAGERALALADELGLEATSVHALTTLGIMDAYGGRPGRAPSVDRLEAAARRARAAGLHAAVTRALINLGEAALHLGRLDEAEERFATVFEWLEGAAPGDLVHLRMVLMRRADLDLARGRWTDAASAADSVLELRGTTSTANQIRVRAVTILGRIRARRGLDGAWPLLDEGLALVGDDELQELAPLYAARIEAAILGGDGLRAAAEADAAVALLRAAAPIPDFLGGAAWYWAWRAGSIDALPAEAPEPYQLEAAGRLRDAAAAWKRIGDPYQRAVVLVAAEDEPALREALDTFLELGARPMARLAADRLRAIGAASIRRGPQARTRRSPAGLTERQAEILGLVACGATNRDIATALVISSKTVDHHVSAVLRALGVANRRDAGRVAAELGIDAPPSPKDRESGPRVQR